MTHSERAREIVDAAHEGWGEYNASILKERITAALEAARSEALETGVRIGIASAHLAAIQVVYDYGKEVRGEVLSSSVFAHEREIGAQKAVHAISQLDPKAALKGPA